MTIKYLELIHAAEVVAAEEEMQVTVTCSLAGAAFTAATTFAGGLLAGPIGLALGGIFGGVSSGAMSKGKFKSVVEVIRNDLTPKQREKFVQHLENTISEITPLDVMELAAMILAQQDLKAAIAKAIISFFRNELHKSVTTGVHTLN